MGKIGDLSPPIDISAVFSDIYQNFSSPIYHYDISCRNLPIHDMLTIYHDIFVHGCAYTFTNQ